MEKPYVFIFTKNLEKLHLVDLRKSRNFDDVIDDILYFNAVGVRSNYKDPFRAKFKRTRSERIASESELIALEDKPIRLKVIELVQLLRHFNTRGKDKIQRVMNPASLKNLQKSKPWTTETKPIKPIQIQDAVIDKAEDLRQGGLSWKKVAERVGENPNSLRSAIRRKTKATNLLIKG
jgi:hypothetical protein